MVTTPSAPKTIILTGGTRGLGWEMAEALIDAGHCVVITGQQHGPHLGQWASGLPGDGAHGG